MTKESSIEADKLKLKAHVKRLRSENNWHHKALHKIQRLLQKTEIKTTTDKEHLKIVHGLEKIQIDLMDINAQGEEITDDKDGKNGCQGYGLDINYPGLWQLVPPTSVV